MKKFDPEKITVIAKTDARGQEIPFGIKAKDRQRHVYIIGKTGMGKSTLLENMAAQDILGGEGMAFIDPHGSAAETLLSYIPEHRKDDVVYFAPFDMEHPISFNIMEDVGPDKRHLVVSGLMSVFEKIWVDAWSARMAYILQNTLMALLEYPGSTLLGVNRMLSDKDYRKRVVDNVKDPGVRSFWVDEFAKYNERYMQEAGDAIKNKIGQFTANPVIRNIIGQPKSSFDIRKIMDEQKIIIMNLSKGLIGETNANLLGSMLTTRIYLAAMSRADLPLEQMRTMPNFYFFVDEFQSFANSTFSNILSEARKYHLNLTIAHQYIEQMEEDVRNAVFGNVGTIISFRVGPFDAEILETIFSPQFLATDIVNLSFAQVYMTLMIDGIGSQPFSARTLPAMVPLTVSCKDMVIASSRRQFARPRMEVEEEIRKFHEPVEPEPKREVTKSSTQPAAPIAAVSESAEPRVPLERRERTGNGERTAANSKSDRPAAERPRDRDEKRRTNGSAPSPTPARPPREEAPRPATPEAAPRPPVPAPEKKDHRDELRALLGKIAAPAPAPTKPPVPAPDLKEVISSTLAEPVMAAPTPESVAAPTRLVPDAVPTPPPVQAGQAKDPSPPSLSAEELKRLLNVSPHDKNPY
jgi:hypothetical protein